MMDDTLVRIFTAVAIANALTIIVRYFGIAEISFLILTAFAINQFLKDNGFEAPSFLKWKKSKDL